MSQLVESKGLILSSRNYKEKDKLVKIFTESSGKMMFYIKGIHRQNQPLAPALLPLPKQSISVIFEVKVCRFKQCQRRPCVSEHPRYLFERLWYVFAKSSRCSNRRSSI